MILVPQVVFGSKNVQKSFEWKPSSLSGSQFVLQTSTNLTNWITLFTISNDSSVYNYFPYTPQDTRRFYRLVPP